MTRVGFVMPTTLDGWLGGVSYYRNLLNAIREAGGRIEPVIFTSAAGMSRVRAEFPDIAVVETTLVDSPALLRRGWRIAQHILGRDIPLENLLLRHRIDLLSHAGYLGRRSPIASMIWIPDFQELALPSFFSPSQRASRARGVRTACAHASAIVLSSEAAKRDLKSIEASGDALHEVLQFVANMPGESERTPRAALQEKYGLPDRYFHLPNQFWAHKNHALVLQALAMLRAQGRPVTVLATGNTSDHRQPGHFQGLMDEAKRLGVMADFRPLGIVPFEDLMGLMHHSVAVINPSRFEGWSTSVEEAKSMGKAVLLSDIPVHREQAPRRGRYFSSDDADALALALDESVSGWSSDEERSHMANAALDLPTRRRAFAERYETIVHATLAHHNRRRA